MADWNLDYYKPEYMQDKRMSDLASNPSFMTDAMTFLTSARKGYTEEEVDQMSADDIVGEVLNHFRVQSTNEVTMSKDFYFVSDEETPEAAKQSYGRLLYAFDNAKSEGLFDDFGTTVSTIADYGEGVLTAPTTWGSIAAGAFTAGTGAAAIQGSKVAAQTALRKVASKYLGRAAISGAIDGTIGAGHALGSERIKQKAGQEIGEDYDINMTNVAIGGAVGAVTGAAGYYFPARAQNKAALRFNEDVIVPGAEEYTKRYASANAAADEAVKRVTSTEGGSKKVKAVSDLMLRSIDPKLVREGQQIKANIFSEDLPQYLIAGINPATMKRIGAAALEVAEELGVKLEKGERITEYLARSLSGDGRATTIAKVQEIADRFGISTKQLSAAYAAEVSDAARLLAAQKDIKGIQKLKTTVDDLLKEGMTEVGADEVQAIVKAEQQMAGGTGVIGKAWRGFKDFENARRMFMTSQPATAMRNNIFSGAMTVIDALDQFNTGVIRAAKGNPKAAVATWKGALDVFKYLSADAYVADAFNQILHKNAPEQMQRVFFEAAQAENALVKNSNLSKAGAAVNVLNTMSDFVVKRAVITATIDRELRQLGDEALGTSVKGMLEKGTTDLLPEDILAKALDASTDFTFQKRFSRGADVSAEHRFVGTVVDSMHKYGLTVLTPFPRFLASQAKFISDYGPLTIARRLGRGNLPSEEEFAKSVTGATMFAGLYAVQMDNVEKDLEWYETEVNGQVMNAQSALGPAALHAYLANIVARHSLGKEMPSERKMLADIGKIIGATEFRPGPGLANAAIQYVETENFDPLGKQISDYFGSYFYPAAVAKDLYGQFDPRASIIPNTRDVTHVNLVETSFGIDVSQALYSRITKQFPDVSLPTMANTLKEMTGIDLPVDTLKGWRDYFNGQTRTYFQKKYSGIDMTDESYHGISFAIFQDGPAKLYNPIQKQLTGFVGRPKKNELEKAMTRLAIDPFEVYNPYREKNATLELATQQILQGSLAREADEILTGRKPIQTKSGPVDFRTMPQDMQRYELQQWIKERVSGARKYARDWLEKAAANPETSKDYASFVEGEYKAMGPMDRQAADVMWNQYGKALGFDGMSFVEALKSLRDNPDVDDDELPYKRTNLMQSYMYLGSEYAKDK